jgi:hypothetical protein
MAAAGERHTPEDLARLGIEIFDRKVRPALEASDDGKFVAVGLSSGAYELNEDDYAAVQRLRYRRPDAEIWLGRVG